MEHNIHPLFLARHPGIKQAVESGEIEGVPFKIADGEIEPGDMYIAERNVGLKLLTCQKNDKANGWIVPTELAYSYDRGECIKIELCL